MYPLAHLFFAQKLFGFLNPPLALGSVFPDMIVSSGLDWEESHSLGCNFWELFKVKNNNLKHFSLGVISHGVEPKGLDYYSDEKYKDCERGYCYEKARPIINKVVQACSLSNEDGWWKAHNFIEMSVDLYVYRLRPQLLNVLREAFNDIFLMKEISREIADPLNVDISIIHKSADLFSQFVLEAPSDAYSLAKRFQSQVYFKDNIYSIDIKKCAEVIEEGIELITPDIEDFFDHVYGEMLQMLKNSSCL